MKRMIMVAMLAAPGIGLADSGFLGIDQTVALFDGAVMETNPKTIEFLSDGVARYANPGFDEKDKESAKYILGKWHVKQAALSEDEKQLPNAQALLEERNADLRSVFCETWDRTLCWDVEQQTFEREDPKCEGEDCALAKRQTYRLYREGRGETRTVVISRR
ncbi:MAG: hypothetical protein H6983_00365 [Ectothiorhodospiraceae bacterium]|nr:hypothetical protein [Ectothiorhodospiraceae bacterium]